MHFSLTAFKENEPFYEDELGIDDQQTTANPLGFQTYEVKKGIDQNGAALIDIAIKVKSQMDAVEFRCYENKANYKSAFLTVILSKLLFCHVLSRPTGL